MVEIGPLQKSGEGHGLPLSSPNGATDPLSGKSVILEISMSYLRLLEVCDTKRV